MTAQYDIYLIYLHSDAEQVEELGRRLEDRAGLHVWFDKWALIPGIPNQPQMAKGLNEIPACAVFIGEQTDPGWFRKELQLALNRQSRDEKFRVIPVMLPGADPKCRNDFLDLNTFVEFAKGLDDAAAFHRLVSGAKGVPPGRGPGEPLPHELSLDLKNILATVRQLADQKIICEEIARDFQRNALVVHFNMPWRLNEQHTTKP